MQESGQITAHIRQPKHLIHAKEILFDHRWTGVSRFEFQEMILHFLELLEIRTNKSKKKCGRTNGRRGKTTRADKVWQKRICTMGKVLIHILGKKRTNLWATFLHNLTDDFCADTREKMFATENKKGVWHDSLFCRD
jgi:hypothetical protein